MSRSTARIAPAALIVGAIALLAVAPLAWRWASQATTPPSAVIVDQLSLTDPNPNFVAEATRRLQAAGYVVDYVPGERATVAFHRRLALRGDALIVLRSHAARIGSLASDGVGVELGDDVALFSGEPIDLERYRISNVPEPAATAVAAALAGGDTHVAWATAEPLGVEEVGRLMPVFYDPASGEMPFFGIRPDYVAQHFEGNFRGATVLMMGCDGLRGEAMAAAFLARGADHFVSWDNSVSAAHTDEATLELLDRWLEQGTPLHEAVAATKRSRGPDPYYDGQLGVVSRGG